MSVWRARSDLGEVVDRFARGVLLQAMENSRGESGDEHATAYIAAWKELRAAGPAGLDALASLLTHQEDCVRVMAAAFLLRHRSAEAKTILEQAAKGRSLAALGARQALLRLELGVLDVED